MQHAGGGIFNCLLLLLPLLLLILLLLLLLLSLLFIIVCTPTPARSRPLSLTSQTIDQLFSCVSCLQPTTAACNALVAAYASCGQWERAMEMPSAMRALQVAPSVETFYSVVTVLGMHDQWHWAATVHAEMAEAGMGQKHIIALDRYTSNTVVVRLMKINKKYIHSILVLRIENVNVSILVSLFFYFFYIFYFILRLIINNINMIQSIC
jgi:hypothetical protein